VLDIAGWGVPNVFCQRLD